MQRFREIKKIAESLSTVFELPKSIKAASSYWVLRKCVKYFLGSSSPSPSFPNFFTKLGFSPPQQLSDNIWMTEIGQSVFELYLHKEKVGRSTSWSKCNSHGALHIIPKQFFSITHRFGATGRNMLQWPRDNHNKALVGALKRHVVNAKIQFSLRYPQNPTTNTKPVCRN